MVFRKIIAAAAILALLLGTFSITSYVTAGTEGKAPTWEYRVIGKRMLDRSLVEEGARKEAGNAIMSEFNYQGGEGWDYVGTIPGKGDAYFCVFKRQK